MAKNLVSKPILVLLTQIWTQHFFYGFSLYYIIDTVASYHCMQFQGILMNQIWENGKKPTFRTDFGSFSPNLGQEIFLWILPPPHIRHCFKLSLYAISRKTNEPNFFGHNFGPFGSISHYISWSAIIMYTIRKN